MIITLAEFAVITLTGIAVGWLWTSPDAHVLEPIRRPVNRSLSRAGTIGRYVRTGSECAVCVGWWAQLAAMIAVNGWHGWSVGLAAAAMMLHVLWQMVIGAMTAVILR